MRRQPTIAAPASLIGLSRLLWQTLSLQRVNQVTQRFPRPTRRDSRHRFTRLSRRFRFRTGGPGSQRHIPGEIPVIGATEHAA